VIVLERRRLARSSPSRFQLGRIFRALAILFLFGSAAAAFASTQTPANDNYLFPFDLNQPGTVLLLSYKATGDTIGATVQPNIFSPCDMSTCGSGPAEPTTCHTPTYATYGHTVWYRFYPDHDGQVEIHTSGFPNVIALYRLDPSTESLTLVSCESGSSAMKSNDLFDYVKRDVAYEYQIGGRDMWAGTFGMDFYYAYGANLTVAPFRTSARVPRRRRLSGLKFTGVTPGEEVSFVCAAECSPGASGAEVTQGTTALLNTTPAPAVGATTRLVVGVTAPAQVGRFKVYTLNAPKKHLALTAQGCLAPGVTVVSRAAAMDPLLLDTYTCPAAAPLNPAGAEFVFWIGARRGLYDSWWSGTHWSQRYKITDQVLGSRPAVAVHADGEQDVFWRSASGDLMESYYAGQWIGPTTLQTGALASAPSVGVDAAGDEYVFWQGTDGRLWEKTYTSANGSWNPPSPVNAGKLGSPPAVAVHPGGQLDVFWKGLNRDLWEARFTDGSWGSASEFHDGPLGSAPSVGIDGAGDEYVFWRGIDGGLWEKTLSNGNWTQSVPVANAGTLGSPPTVAVHAGGEQDVFWSGPKGDLIEMYDTGQWIGPRHLGPRHLSLYGPGAGVGPAGT
jgi:hypothetical protein